MHGYIEPFYERANEELAAGHLWCDQPLYLPGKHGLKLTRVDAEDDRQLQVEVVGRTTDTFQHNPVKSLKLTSTEALVGVKTKRDRPIILLGGLGASEILPGKEAQPNPIAWALPIYRSTNYDRAIRERIQRYEFSNFFYLPEDPDLSFTEGFARLDHAQPVWRDHLTKHRGMKLSSDALDALTEWFIYFTTGYISGASQILDYQREQRADPS